MRCKITRHVQPDGMFARVKHPGEGVKFLAVRGCVPCNDRQIRWIVVSQSRYVVAHHVPHIFVSFLRIPTSKLCRLSKKDLHPSTFVQSPTNLAPISAAQPGGSVTAMLNVELSARTAMESAPALIIPICVVLFGKWSKRLSPCTAIVGF